MTHEMILIREATLDDAKGIAKVHVDSWRSTYSNIVPDEDLNNLSYERREQLWINNMATGKVYVAVESDGTIVGFSCGGKERSGNYAGYEGELYAIYILKDYQGQGIGRKLVKPVVDEILELGMNSMIVCVLKDNPSCAFYEALGGIVIDSIEIEIGGKNLEELVYGWKDISTL